MSASIRVLVANRPKLMREAVLATFAGHADLEIVGEVSDDAEIANLVNKTLPNVLIITLEDSGERPPICEPMLRAHPEIRIIAISSRKDYSICYWANMQIQSKNIEATEDDMLMAVRSIGAGKAGFR